MKNFLELGNRFAQQSSWKDFALTKFCLCAMGVIIGLLLPEICKSTALIIAAIVFAVTYALLMTKVFRIIKEMKDKEWPQRGRD